MQKRIPQLDAVRGLAILLVVFHNQSGKYPTLHLSDVFAYGWMGVDLFFVLSGYLITGILLDSKTSEEYFKCFYVRRCLRIWPLYYAIVLFMFAVVPWLRPAQAHIVFGRSSPWWSFLFFGQNFFVPHLTNAAGALAVTWSLAIEEQFYLIWPWVVRYCSSSQLQRIALSVFCLSPFLRLILSSRGVDLYTNTFCRLDGLMAGALMALYSRSADFTRARLVKPAWLALLVALPLAFVLEAFHLRWIVFSLTAAASVSLVYLFVHSQSIWIQRVATNRFLIYTGTISYGLYLLHKIPFDIADALHLDRHAWMAAPVLFVAAYAIAAVSWHLFEKPVLKLKGHFEPKPKGTMYGV